MTNITNDKGETVTGYGQVIAGPKVDLKALHAALKTGSIQERVAGDIIKRFERLLFPIWMMLAQRAMLGEPAKDEQAIFSFMGSGASDATYVAEFRALLGDERLSEEEIAKMQDEPGAVEEVVFD